MTIAAMTWLDSPPCLGRFISNRYMNKSVMPDNPPNILPLEALVDDCIGEAPMTPPCITIAERE
jgi:hypothetical protein